MGGQISLPLPLLFMLSRDQSDTCLPAAYMKVAGLKTERPVLYVLMAVGGGGGFGNSSWGRRERKV